MRFLVAVFTLLWCGLAIWASVQNGVGPGLIVGLIFVAFGGALGLRMLGIAAIARGDELLVRNAYRTHRLPRSEVEAFSTGHGPMAAFKRTIYVILANETIGLDVGLTLFSLLDGPGALEERRQELEGWLADAA